jgi:hypothetical protein
MYIYIRCMYVFIYIRIGMQHVITYAKLTVKDLIIERSKLQCYCTKLLISVKVFPVAGGRKV